MYHPFLIEFDYKVINNATGQIVRTFWEKVPSDEWCPTIVCAKRENSFMSNWELCEIEDNQHLTRWLMGLRHIGFSDLVWQPDIIYHIWGKRVIKKAKNIINSRMCDYIHSISCPYGDHIVAMEIKKRTGLPWIAQFFDPWIGNTANFHTSFFRSKFEAMEYAIAKNADYIIHTNSIIAEEWKKRYGSLVSNKMKVLPLTFNTSNLPVVKPIQNNGKLVLSHIGHIYESRSLKDVVDAIKTLSIEIPEVLNKLEILIVGKVDNGEKEYIRGCGLDRVFIFAGLVAPDQLDSYYQKSDAFIALDLNTNNCQSFPSKLMLYYYYKKPIIGITTRGSVMESDLLKSKHNVFYYGESQRICEYLKSLLYDKEPQYSFTTDYWRNFTVEKGIEEYKKIVDGIVLDKYNRT